MENVDSAINVKGKATSNLTKMTAVTVNTGNGTATDEAQRDLRTSITGVHDGAISENQVSLEHQPSPASINSSLSSTSWERISLCSINMNQLSIPKPNKAGEAGSQSVVGAKAFSEKDSAESTDRKTSWNPFKYFKSLKTFEKKKKPQDKHLWTIEDAFFAAIGGYAVRSDSFWPSTYSETLTFTPLGIIELARLGLLTKADSATVSDKSKADVVAKIIVCIQATWFFFQCIARLIQGLSVTLLEIHVLAHVACTFVMYFFWFHKPYNVEHPIILTDEKVLDFAALFAVAGPEVKTTHPQLRYCFLLCSSANFYKEESHVACGPQRVCRQSPSVIIEQVQYAQYLTSRLNRLKTLYKDMLIDIIMPCSAETEGELSDDEDEHSDEGDEEMTEEEVANQIGNGLVKEAWLRANRALDVYKPMEIVLTAEERENIHVPASQKQQKEGDIEILHILTQPHVVVRKKNHELNPLIELANVPKSRFHKHAKYTFTAMSIMYGAIHLAAWNAFFSSVAEMWIWRALAIEIVSIPPLLLFWHELLQDNSKGLSTRKSFEGIVKGIRLALDVLVMASLFFTLGVGYVFGRLFIFGEVFANLREVLPDTYTTVEWTNFIPHAG